MLRKRFVTKSSVMFLCSHFKLQFCVNNHKILLRHLSFSPSRYSNTQPSVATQDRHETNDSQISLLNHKTKLEKRFLLKIKRTPFIKNLYIGKYDQDVLAFPEIHDNKEIAAINKMSDQVRKYVLANVDSEDVDRTGTFPQTVLDQTKKMGLFGCQVPQHYGGLGLTATEHVRIMEACSVDSSLPVLLNTHHSIAMQGILSQASENIKSTYLPKLATGEITAALGFSEQENENDISSVNTVASRVQGDRFILSGKKTWVVNAENADIFLVLAKTHDPVNSGIDDERYAVFLVERDMPGVFIHKPEEKLGIRGANISAVEFRETPVPFSNMICDNKMGHQVVLNILMMNRFHTGAFTSGLAKALVEIATDHCINTNLFLKPLMDFQGTKQRVGKILQKAYEMESITYFTAGLFDSTEDPDLDLECCAVKVFCTEGLWYCVNELLSLMGPAASLSGHPVERILRDSRMWLMFDGPNDLIRQYISLAALNSCKKEIADDVQKLRNPMFFPRFSFMKFLENLRHERGNLKLTLDLQGYLHPSLQIGANFMEYSVHRLKHAFEKVLQRSGVLILEADMDLRRLADMAIEIYVMSAVCSRASRSYSIGLPSADEEITLAVATCQDGHDRVNKLHDDVMRGAAATTDADMTSIAKIAFTKQGYCFTPPFTRNY